MEDAVGFNANDANLFRYVGNNTINYTDPTGLQAKKGEIPENFFSLPAAEKDQLIQEASETTRDLTLRELSFVMKYHQARIDVGRDSKPAYKILETQASELVKLSVQWKRQEIRISQAFTWGSLGAIETLALKAEIARHIANLDDDAFEVRQKAEKALVKLGPLAADFVFTTPNLSVEQKESGKDIYQAYGRGWDFRATALLESLKSLSPKNRDTVLESMIGSKPPDWPIPYDQIARAAKKSLQK
jgi:hypothetical protein